MCSGSEADSYSRLIDFVYHSTLGLRVRRCKGAPGGEVVWARRLFCPPVCAHRGTSPISNLVHTGLAGLWPHTMWSTPARRLFYPPVRMRDIELDREK